MNHYHSKGTKKRGVLVSSLLSLTPLCGWFFKKPSAIALIIFAFGIPLSLFISFFKNRRNNKSIPQKKAVNLNLVRFQNGREIIESSCKEGSIEEKALLAKACLRNSLSPGTYHVRKS